MEPHTTWTQGQFKAWLGKVKATESPRIDRLRVIASGPCGRDDVQAARRLLCKPRYAADDQSST